MGAQPDWGILAKAVLAGIAAKGIKSHMNARSVNQYAQRAGLDYNVGNFYGGDPKSAYEQIDALQKAKQEQKASDYIAQYAGLPTGPLSAVEKVFSGEVAPIRQKKEEDRIKGEAGRKELQGLSDLLTVIGASAGGGGRNPQVQPAMPTPTIGPPPKAGESAMEVDPYVSGQPMQAGATYQDMPDLPDYVTPETLRRAIGLYGQMRGQDVTTRGQDLNRQTAQERLAEQKRMNDARINYQLQRIGIDKQRVALYAKAISQRAGRAPTKVEVAQQMLRNGEITKDQFRDFILAAPAMDMMSLLGGGTAPAGGDASAEADAYLMGE